MENCKECKCEIDRDFPCPHNCYFCSDRDPEIEDGGMAQMILNKE